MAADPEGNQSSYLGSVNCDLWHRFLPWRAITAVDKVKAHTSLKDVASGSIEFDKLFGNAVADILAGHAAHLSALPDLTLQQLAENSSLAFMVCMRLAVCEGIHKAANETCIDRS